MTEAVQKVGMTQLVKAFHRSERQIRNLITQGTLPKPMEYVGRKPVYDYWVMHHAFIDYVTGKGGLSGIAKKQEEKIDKQNRKMDREDAVARGILVEIAQVQKDAFDTGRKVRDAMLNIPDRVSAVLAGEKKESKIRKLLISEIKNALIDINPYEK